ncbi:response regulator [Salidesulfovibrio brasiliensis]|uniref:response regulator n=1 Tax=Salidesulfovibrio brasiliensis TaxID=221711 RepID=UPI0006D015D8|nr:response regulator [Salidesulfovibrio brasiliensis]
METDGTILIIDDDEKLRALLTQYLEGYGYSVLTLPSGVEAVGTVRESSPCIVVLDVMMPGPDGFDVLREIRAASSVPVIMLTAKGEDADRIVGLELGADDYMPKPFNPRELLARIKAVLRRYPGERPQTSGAPKLLEAGGLSLDLSRQLLLIDGDELELTSTGFRLLKAFMENRDKALTRDELMNLVWDREFSAYDRSIDVHVSKLRTMLKPYPAHEKRIRTVWGTGYMFVGSV